MWLASPLTTTAGKIQRQRQASPNNGAGPTQRQRGNWDPHIKCHCLSPSLTTSPPNIFLFLCLFIFFNFYCPLFLGGISILNYSFFLLTTSVFFFFFCSFTTFIFSFIHFFCSADTFFICCLQSNNRQQKENENKGKKKTIIRVFVVV